MMIYVNHPDFKTKLSELFSDHQLEPLWINKMHPKVAFAFLHINDPEELKTLRKQFKGLLVISIEDEANIHAYLQYQPFYIIRQNYFEEDLHTLIGLLDHYLFENYATLPIKLGSSTLQLAVSSIQYVESFNHYLTLHTTHGQYSLRQNMQNLQMQLKGFIRVHKSYIVAIREIAEIQSTQLILKDQTIIPVGRTYKKDLSFIELS